MSGPVEIQYFYKIKWGFHDEWIALFRKNHWPILKERMAQGRYTSVRMFTPTFHGDGLAGWNVMVSIVYRDWAAVAEHSDPALIARLYPDQDAFRAEEQRRFELLEAHWDVALEEQTLA
jgi:hypothetical protein